MYLVGDVFGGLRWLFAPASELIPWLIDTSSTCRDTCFHSKVDKESLKTQVGILTSGASPDTKRSQLVSSKINEIQELAQDNIGEIQTLKDSVGGSVQTLTTYSENLEERVAELELKLSQLNQACFAANLNQNSNSQGQRTPGFNVDTPPNDDSASFTSGGRRLADDCIKKDPNAEAVDGSATGLISIAASTVAALFLWL